MKNKEGSAWLRNLTKFIQVLRVRLKIQTLVGLCPKSRLLPPPPRGPLHYDVVGICWTLLPPNFQLPVPCEVPAGKRRYPQTGHLRSLSERDYLPRAKEEY